MLHKKNFHKTALFGISKKWGLFCFFILTVCMNVFSINHTMNALQMSTAYTLFEKAQKNDVLCLTGNLIGSKCLAIHPLSTMASAGSATPHAETNEKSWDLFSWLFNSKGESTWFTILKWLFVLGIGFVLAKILLQIIGIMIGLGACFGFNALFIGFILKWLNLIDTDTMWTIAKYGFYGGCGLGFLYNIFHIKDLFDFSGLSDYATQRSTPSTNKDGLKSYSIIVDGREYILKQDSKYSECNYTDQYGGKWDRNSSGFHPV